MVPFLHANRIYCPGTEKTVDSYVSFYESVDVPEGAGLILFVSAHTDYCLYDGGKPLLKISGQFPDYENEPVFDRIPLDGILSPGYHDLEFVLYTQGCDFSTHRASFPGIIYEITNDGKVFCFSSQATLCRINDRFFSGGCVNVSGQLGFTFRYDASENIRTHETKNAKIAPVFGNFTQRPVEKLVFGDEKNVKTVSEGYFTGDKVTAGAQYGKIMLDASLYQRMPENGSDGKYMITDLGRETAGLLHFIADLSEDAEILVGWGEHLDDGKCEDLPSGRVRSYISGRNFCCSYKGRKGRNDFTMPFLRLGARYLEMHVYDTSATIQKLTLIPVSYPLSKCASVSGVDETWRKIFNVSLDTLRLCMHEHYEDCPWREQSLYSMDSRNQMLCGYFAFGETRFAFASLRLMAKSLRKDGMLELCSPARVSITIPSFSAVFITACEEYLQYSGDKKGISELYPTVLAVGNAFLSKIDASNGLLKCFKEEQYWNFYEWQDGLEGSISGSIPDDKITYDAPLCAFTAMGFRSLSVISSKLGFKEDSARFAAAYESLCLASDKYFWSEERGAYASFMDLSGKIFHFSELTNSLIAYSGASHGDRLNRTLSALSSGSLIPVTLSHSIFKYEVLLSNGVPASEVMSAVKSRWCKMLDAGATSFWETDEGSSSFDRAGSLCHGWSATPVCLMMKYADKLRKECPELSGMEFN